MTTSDVDERIRKRIDQTTNNETSNNWKFSFEEGVLKSDVNEDALPNEEDKAESHGFFYIKLIRTRWRYDFAFVSPSGIYVVYSHNCIPMQFLVQSFFETLQYCDEWRKFTSVSQSVSQ